MSTILAPLKITRDHGERIDRLQRAGFRVFYVRAEPREIEYGYLSPYGHTGYALPGSRAYVDLGDVASDAEDNYYDGFTGSTISRSNYRSLNRDYPETFTRISYSDSNSLAALVAHLTDEHVSILCGLKVDYPLYDESDLSELESEEISESWGQYVQADLTSEINSSLAEEISDLWDELSDDDQRTMFWSVCDDLDIYPEHDGHDIHWTAHYPAIVEAIDSKLAAA